MYDKIKKQSTILIITLLIPIIITSLFLHKKNKEISIQKEKIAFEQQRTTIERFKEKYGDYPNTDTYNDLRYMLKGEFHYWPETEDGTWGRYYKTMDNNQDYMLMGKKGSTTITCAHKEIECK